MLGAAGRLGPVGGVDRHEEAGQGLARAGRRGDQDVLAGQDPGPCPALGFRGTAGEAPPEPGRDGRMELGRDAVRGTAVGSGGAGASVVRHGVGGGGLEGTRQRGPDHRPSLRAGCHAEPGRLTLGPGSERGNRCGRTRRRVQRSAAGGSGRGGPDRGRGRHVRRVRGSCGGAPGCARGRARRLVELRRAVSGDGLDDLGTTSRDPGRRGIWRTARPRWSTGSATRPSSSNWTRSCVTWTTPSVGSTVGSTASASCAVSPSARHDSRHCRPPGSAYATRCRPVGSVGGAGTVFFR